MKAAALILLLAAPAAFADGAIVTTTIKATEWVRKTPDNTVISRHTTREECEAVTSVGTFNCDQRVTITAVGACSIEAPVWPLVLDAEGRLVAPGLKVEELADGSWGPNQEEGYVLTSYPACWVKGWVPYSGKWRAPEGSPVMEPVFIPGETPPP